MNDIISECVVINQMLPKSGLVKLTWGNASILSDCKTKIAIKPSGIPFEKLTKEDISVVSIEDGFHLSGKKPSVDLPMHLEIYREFREVKSVIHTHSKYATAWAQAVMPIPILGTTHADYFEGDIPVCFSLTEDVQLENYEFNLGKTVCSFYKEKRMHPLFNPAVLIPFHGCLVFGESPTKALENAIVLEDVAEMAMYTYILGQKTTKSIAIPLFKKHFDRKNGKERYYGQ